MLRLFWLVSIVFNFYLIRPYAVTVEYGVLANSGVSPKFNSNIALSQHQRLNLPAYTASDTVLPSIIINFVTEIPDIISAWNFAQKYIDSLHRQGYLQAKADTLVSENNSHTLHISRGQLFYYKLDKGNLEKLNGLEKILDTAIFNGPIGFVKFEKMTNKILHHLENSGFPFARIYKTGILINKPYINATLHLDKQNSITFAPVRIPPDIKLSQDFISNLLEIRVGMPYNENLVRLSSERLKNLTFARLNGPVSVSFDHRTASLYLPLLPLRSNRFDGIIGLAGGENPGLPAQITGSLDLYLINTFGQGEFLDLFWKSLGHGTQILELNGGYPFPLGLPVKPEIAFSIHKQDTSWLRINYRPQLRFNPGRPLSFSVFASVEQNNLLSIIDRQNQVSPPINLDFRRQLYGAELLYRTPGFESDLPDPGHSIRISLSAGDQSIISNSSIPVQVHEGTRMQKTLYEMQFDIGKRIILSPGLRFEISGHGILNSGTHLLDNQLLRIGGFKTLKGFDELSISASSYIFALSELRLYTSERSFFSTFLNGGWYERKQSGNYHNNFPIGAGVGLNLETQAGIFAMYFAIGAHQNMQPQIRNTKIHIGYTTIF